MRLEETIKNMRLEAKHPSIRYHEVGAETGNRFKSGGYHAIRLEIIMFLESCRGP